METYRRYRVAICIVTQGKGPNSQGGSSGKTIATCQRGIDPSFVGRIDLNVVGNSDPKIVWGIY
jgi:hypothetical protein